MFVWYMLRIYLYLLYVWLSVVYCKYPVYFCGDCASAGGIFKKKQFFISFYWCFELVSLKFKEQKTPKYKSII